MTKQDLMDMVPKPKNVKNFDDVMTIDSFFVRHVLIAEIDDEVSEAVEHMIRFWNQYDDENNIPIEDRKPIVIFIDSPGGSLLATFTIIDTIKMSKTPVWTVNIGTAYSGGFFIFISGHKRFCYPHSSFLYHEGATEIGGDAGKFQNFASFYKFQLSQLKDIVLENTKISAELYDEKRRDDWWISAAEAIQLGCADEIIKEFVN